MPRGPQASLALTLFFPASLVTRTLTLLTATTATGLLFDQITLTQTSLQEDLEDFYYGLAMDRSLGFASKRRVHWQTRLEIPSYRHNRIHL